MCILRGKLPLVQGVNETDMAILTVHAVETYMILYHSVSQPFFHGGTHSTFVHIPMNPLPVKNLQARKS